ncbi:hypothetical protein BATR1942_19485 [Bacillus atrophaeus 1942]|uniref:NADAR domain-containing protein n=1 Tax=Bacillus atrophaeus (strain 1942) TaxID=720555 RepID=A0ABM5M3T0_BACA1|nr:hypothetical protein BATR1942_19485 [Bacillus atrophaeus 1942]EIM09891.1 hypothetical protein UY9_14814 [Bacillus atrophaeus C89]
MATLLWQERSYENHDSGDTQLIIDSLSFDAAWGIGTNIPPTNSRSSLYETIKYRKITLFFQEIKEG